MPYSGSGDPDLPPNVKKMPAAKRGRWVRIWNSVFKNCRSPKVGAPGSVNKCEGAAFRFANGAVKELKMENEIEALMIMREKAEGEEAEILDSAIQELKEKCPPSEMKPNPIFAGSTSFGDYDDFVEAQEQEMQVRDTTFIFRGLVDNIFSREDWNLARKASAVAAAARELSARVQETPSKTWLEKMKHLIWPSGQEEKTGVATHNPSKIEEGSWNGAAASRELRRWASSDGSGDADKMSWTKLRRGYAAYDPPGEKFGDMWGPHHRIRNGTLMTQRSGVVAAFQAASGARAGVRRNDALPHLNAHRRQFGIGQREMEELIGVSFKELGLPDDEEAKGVFSSFKDANGIWRWMVINTNKFEDREGEIFSEKSHKEYIAYVEKTGDWPELWLWHTPGTKIGVASMVDYVDGFVVHAGTYDEGFDDVAERLQKMQSKTGVSHGYEYLEGDEKDGVYDHYRTFELTLCPAARAANIWGTGFNTFQKEVSMGFSEEKRDFFVGILGEDQVASLEEKLPALAKELEGKGINFKDLAESLLETKAEEEAATEEEGTPVVEEAEVEVVVETEEETPTVEERLTALEDGQGKVLTAIGELTSSVKAANETVGERIDEALSGEKPPKTNGKRPSESKETEVPEEEVEETVIGFSEATPEESPARTLVEDLLKRGPAVASS